MYIIAWAGLGVLIPSCKWYRSVMPGRTDCQFTAQLQRTLARDEKLTEAGLNHVSPCLQASAF